MSRLPTGGVVDRDTALDFTFNGKTFTGYGGDTLASALLAEDVRLVARSFKYHRPRGIVSAGSEEPNALVTAGVGAAQTPNLRATELPLTQGLAARSQNHVGPLWWDALAVNDWLGLFLGAGFYYKTFMWPKSFWERLYEPAIRRAAGLGALSGAADPDHHDKAWAHCDVLIIGAGPAGLMAALTAGRAGADVILAEADFVLGGRLRGERGEVAGKPGTIWADGVLAELGAMRNVRIMPRTVIFGAYDGGTYGAWQQHAVQRPKSTFWRIVARRAILTTGAHERLIAFPNNDRPGVMQAGAVRTYLNRFGVSPGRRTVVWTNNDDGLQTARDLMAAGQRVGAVVDTREGGAPGFNCPVFQGAVIVDTRGRLGVSGVKLRDARGAVHWVEADCLAVSGGWNPAVHLACHLGGKPKWEQSLAAFCAHRDMMPGMEVAGAAGGDFSTYQALHSGAAAAMSALDLTTRPDIPSAEDSPAKLTPFWYVSGQKRAWIDVQNDVTTKDVGLAIRENFTAAEHVKRYTTLGMATDQGKTSNVTGLAVIAAMTGQEIPDVGTTTFRPPYVPIPIAAMGAGGKGKGFAPERYSPCHGICEARGAPLMEAGHWYRPSWFPRHGETHWRHSCDREVVTVRRAVGVCDVSTLGKIDVQGPDAGRFLDLVYTNVMSGLAVGRVRYGLMLREDGFVMDDGTCARMGDDHFVVTTTTSGAGQVMAHLEFVQQCIVPEWDVQIVSISDSWAQIAIAGPLSHDLLNGVLTTTVSRTGPPFMGWSNVTYGDVDARLFRISFSGELGYEIAVPARFGAGVFRDLIARAEAMGGCVYGMEALNILRLEVGFLTHAEIDGRVTAQDLGMAGMVSDRKDCIGKIMARRTYLASDERAQLVGLKPVGAVQKLLAGSHIVNVDARLSSEADQGYLTSVGYSPTLSHMIGLGFLKNGRSRVGETVRCVDLLRDFDTLCRVVDPRFHVPGKEDTRD